MIKDKQTGLQLDYSLKPGMSSKFNQKMFGRIYSRSNINSKYYHYIPGVLDDVQYYRIFDGRIFISTTNKVDFNPIMEYCETFELVATTKDYQDVPLKTAREKWIFHAKEKKIEVSWPKNDVKRKNL